MSAQLEDSIYCAKVNMNILEPAVLRIRSRFYRIRMVQKDRIRIRVNQKDRIRIHNTDLNITP